MNPLISFASSCRTSPVEARQARTPCVALGVSTGLAGAVEAQPPQQVAAGRRWAVEVTGLEIPKAHLERDAKYAYFMAFHGNFWLLMFIVAFYGVKLLPGHVVQSSCPSRMSRAARRVSVSVSGFQPRAVFHDFWRFRRL